MGLRKIYAKTIKKKNNIFTRTSENNILKYIEDKI